MSDVRRFVQGEFQQISDDVRGDAREMSTRGGAAADFGGAFDEPPPGPEQMQTG